MASKFIKSAPKTIKLPEVKTRALSGRESTYALMASFCGQWMIENLEELKNTTLYSGPIKYHTNQLLELLLRHAKETVWNVAEGLEGVNPVEAMEQIESGLKVLQPLFFASLVSAYVHPAQLSLLYMELNKLFIRFNLPATISQNGDIEFLRNPEVEKGGAV